MGAAYHSSRQGRAHHYRQATKQACAGEEAEAADVIRPGQQGMAEGGRRHRKPPEEDDAAVKEQGEQLPHLCLTVVRSGGLLTPEPGPKPHWALSTT